MARATEDVRAVRRPALTRVEVYGDESMKRGPYDLLGSLWVPSVYAPPLRATIAEARAKHACTGEVKWKKCSGSAPHPLYLDIVDIVGREIAAGRAEFKCIVIDRRLVDNHTWNDGDAELGYFKAWWTLLSSKVESGNVYRVRLDALNLQRTNRLTTLRDVLNATGVRDRKLSYPCCESVEARDSKTDDLIQVVDLLTGAVGFHYSGAHRLPGASAGKIAFAQRLCAILRKRELCFQSRPWERDFNVWKWSPRRTKAKRAP
ncbi:MAG TPA: DUF3800 domain-containing protein [Longimicrobiaceae bacterium]|nr:DUF3800 domain-containing protein [Longimicrobiaceae bacterium]